MKIRLPEPCIYVVEVAHADECWIKVGITTDRFSRFSGLQNGCPIEYGRMLFATIDDPSLLELAESIAHVALSGRMHRAEWFVGHADDSTLCKIAVACDLHGIELEWEEHHQKAMSSGSSLRRSVAALRKFRAKREDEHSSRLERDRAGQRKPLTMDEIAGSYGTP